MGAIFEIGDKIQKNKNSNVCTVLEVDVYQHPIPYYYIESNGIKFWDYCLCWEKVGEE